MAVVQLLLLLHCCYGWSWWHGVREDTLPFTTTTATPQCTTAWLSVVATAASMAADSKGWRGRRAYQLSANIQALMTSSLVIHHLLRLPPWVVAAWFVNHHQYKVWVETGSMKIPQTSDIHYT